jgi:2-desacetyl-2-hydroxyethyl bacteriochlorophyllide A dehydrogenase
VDHRASRLSTGGRQVLYFTAPGQVEIVSEPLPEPGPDQLQVQTILSAISPGTERLIYAGQFPQGLPVDETIASLAGSFQYPLRYGYCLVGRVQAAGSRVSPEWLGRVVFSFQPHASHFLARPDELLPLPAGISPENAVFLPNMETAVSFVQDGAPLLGERAVVFGQGIVGLLTTGLLQRFPLQTLLTFDLHPTRRQASIQAGAQESLDPAMPQVWEQARALLPGGADLVFEVSGAPPALDQAIALTGYAGRVVIGSWYGQKPVSLNLGGSFHRSRIRLLSSQVSSLAPELSGRWTKERRFSVAWEMIRQLQPARWITRRSPFQQAGLAYQRLAEQPGEDIQVIFEYS